MSTKIADVFKLPTTGTHVVVDRETKTPVAEGFFTEKEAYDWAVSNGYKQVTLPYHHGIGVN